MNLNYTEQLLFLVSTITGCVLISDFALLVGIPVDIGSSAERLKICATIAAI